MKKILLLAALLVVCAAPRALALPVVGEAAPAFTATDADGKNISLADFKGKTVVLEWTSNECPFVKKHYGAGNMQKLQKEAAAQDVIWLSVDSSAVGKPGYLDGAAAKNWLGSEGAAPAHFLIDASGDVGRLYGAKTTPHMFVIDKDGKLAYAGAIDSVASADPADIAKADNYVTDALTALAAGEQVKLAETQSYGCGVKYGE